MKMKLDFDLKKWLPLLRGIQAYVFGAALIGVFAYTAFVVNAAINVIPPNGALTAADPAAKINFDKKTIESVKKLEVVQGTVPTGDLGKSDPFK